MSTGIVYKIETLQLFELYFILDFYTFVYTKILIASRDDDRFNFQHSLHGNNSVRILDELIWKWKMRMSLELDIFELARTIGWRIYLHNYSVSNHWLIENIFEQNGKMRVTSGDRQVTPALFPSGVLPERRRGKCKCKVCSMLKIEGETKKDLRIKKWN